MESIDRNFFDNLKVENLSRIIAEKENGKKVIGSYCTYCPRELVIAAGAAPFGLCGTTEVSGETDLPRNLCPLIRSSYGLATADKCPYFSISDIVIGETTCDGKKKMFEILKSRNIRDIYVMHLPQMPDSTASLNLWMDELKKVRKYLENSIGVTITDDAVREAIHITNEENRVRKRMFDLNKNKPALISGMDMLSAAANLWFVADCREGIKILDEMSAGIESGALSGYAVGDAATKRILLTGTPVGIGSEKVIRLVEECGALVVAMENCGGYKTVELNIDENDDSDPLLLLSRKYMKVPCSVMTPNFGRIELLRTMVRDFQIDGVIDLTWQACLTYDVESYFVAGLVKNELGLPFLKIETDYSQSDVETLRVRIEAFLEMIPGK